jgi:L-fuculose-phosphate aldolase
VAGRSATDEGALRAEVIAASRGLVAEGLTQGTSGNVSARLGAEMLITPSAVAPEALEPGLIARMPIDGPEDFPAADGPLRPSTEWRFHRDILRARPEIGAVVHAHPPHATALALARREIPPCHYMIAAFGGATVRCAGYALFGTAALSAEVLAALEGRTACLMANHGVVALGETLERALWRAGELEALARQYLLSLAAGGPVLLGEGEIAEALAAFDAYRPAAGARAGL